ncbi:MAG: SH3 domain-containing protein, partial [Anaerolineae bacterium]
ENLSTQLEKIIEALDKNADWVRTHKQISNAAFRWEVAQRDPAFLIVGQYLRTINAEVAKHSGKEPFLSELAAEFLEASNQQQQIEEESQQSRLEKAQQDRQRYILLAAIGVIGSVLLTILTGVMVSRLSNNTSELNVLYVTSTANSQAAATQQATATIAAADATAVIDILAEADAVNLELYNALQTAAAADADLGDVLVPTSTITPSPTIDPYVYLDATPQNCPNAPESRLVVDTIATVLGSRQGVQILLRTAPALGATPITSMQIGQEVQVLEGPVCEDQITWWFVEIGDGRQGYIAEGFFIDDKLVPDYYLQPIEPITDDN